MQHAHSCWAACSRQPCSMLTPAGQHARAIEAACARQQRGMLTLRSPPCAYDLGHRPSWNKMTF
eukprot:355892-Chlamydomonas_euryale.AAC.3